MGMDLTLRMEGVKKRDVSAFLRSAGFEPSQSIVPQRGYSYFYWFEKRGFESISGVEVSLAPEKSLADASESRLILAVHCKIWASVFDVEKMNSVVRQARKRFGGQIDGDYGKNRYIPLWEDRSTPLSRGVTGTYEKALKVLESLKFAIPNETINSPSETTTDATSARILEAVRMLDPARVVFNGLIPMIVAVLEHYFLNVFLVLAQYDADAQAKLREKKVSRGLTGQELLQLANGEIQAESIVAREYSFQSTRGLSSTFREWFALDLNKVLASTRTAQKKKSNLLDGLSALIAYRHDVVHRLDLDRTLSREGLLFQLELAMGVIEATTDAISYKYGFVVDKI